LRVLIPASSLPLAPWVGFHPHFTARGTLPYPCFIRNKTKLRRAA
jgi:hypothetical protein